MFKENIDFYPTPEDLAIKMINKINWRDVKFMLEPSAGASTLIDYVQKYRSRYNSLDIKAIEIDSNLQAILRSKGINVIDSDFLTYQGMEQFDLIIANFPFSQGEKHLLKAIDVLYSGQIVCIINAETLKNPFSNDRKFLIRRLKELNAQIEFIQDAFNTKETERKTNVEIALIYIKIEKDVNNDLLKGMKIDENSYTPDEDIILNNKEVSINDNIASIVREYDFKTKIGIETIIGYYKNYKNIGQYIKLTADNEVLTKRHGFDNTLKQDISTVLKNECNCFLDNIKKSFWRKTLELKEVKEKLTESKRQELVKSLNEYSNMSFTESNIRQFLLNLINSYNDILKDSIEEIFDLMTVKYSYNGTFQDKNIHLYNGWKTNKAFKVNKRVIIPHIELTHSFNDGMYPTFKTIERTNDIDKVMNYFDRNYKTKYKKISDAIRTTQILEDGSKIKIDVYEKLQSEYFEIKLYKKGTAHLTFKDENILRAFNIEAGKKKGWLPNDYGNKKYNELSLEEKELVKNFENNIDDYINNENQIGFREKVIGIELLSA